MAAGDYRGAESIFTKLQWYKDASSYALYCQSILAEAEEDYAAAANGFAYLSTSGSESVQKDAYIRLQYCTALVLERSENYEEASQHLQTIPFYQDASIRLASYPDKIGQRDYAYAEKLESEGQYLGAASVFEALGSYSDSASRYQQALQLQQDVDEKAAAEAAEKQEAANRAAYSAAEQLEAAGSYIEAAAAFAELGDYSDSSSRAENALALQEEAVNSAAYAAAEQLEAAGSYAEAAAAFALLGDYSDSSARAENALALQEETVNSAAYAAAAQLEADGSYVEAAAAFALLGDYSDSTSRAENALALQEETVNSAAYAAAAQLEADGSYMEAAAAFALLGDYGDSSSRAENALALQEEAENSAAYAAAEQLEADGRLSDAASAFAALRGYQDSADRARQIHAAIREQRNAESYAAAQALYDSGRLTESAQAFRALGSYQDSLRRSEAITEEYNCSVYTAAEAAQEAGDYIEASRLYASLDGYKDSAQRVLALKQPVYYQRGSEALAEYDYESAFQYFYYAGDYLDAEQKSYLAGSYFYADSIRGLSADLAVYAFNSEWGFVNFSENLLVHPSWSSIEQITDDVFVVSKAGKYGLTDTSANQLFDCTWDSWERISPDILLICSGGKYGTVSLDGSVAEQPTWTDYRLDENAVIFSVDGQLGMASRTDGHVLLSADYTQISAITPELYRLADASGMMLADSSGKLLTGHSWSAIADTIVDGCLVASKQDGEQLHYGLIGLDGTVIAEPVYTALGDANGSGLNAVFSDGWMLCRNDSGLWGYISGSGECIEPVYQAAERFTNHMAAVRVGGYWGFVNENGELAVEAKYALVYPFNENGVTTALMQNGRYFIITDSGKYSYYSDTRYTAARALEAEGSLEEALALYDALGDYDDCLNRAAAVRYRLIQQCMDSGDYAAAEKYTSAGTVVDNTDTVSRAIYLCAQAAETAGDDAAAVELYLRCGDYEDAAQRAENIRVYLEAEALLQQEQYLESWKLFRSLADFRDSAARAEAIRTEHSISPNLEVRPGDYMTFGSYEQDNDLSNGQEPIEWLVLDVQDGKALLLSRFGLDAKPYNTESENITWEKSTLRSWLNTVLLNKAFTSAEQEAILLTIVDNSKSQGYAGYYLSDGGNTQDRVFLLSYAEANRYLGVRHWLESGADKNMDSRISPTEYAKAQGAGSSARNITTDGGYSCSWWLRSPGISQASAAIVQSDGALSSWTVAGFWGIRPAMWVDLESIVF